MVKKYYESYIIVDGNFEDPVVEEIISKYETLLKDNNAEIVKTDRVGRKRLAYPIQKKQNGYYVCFEFLSEPQFLEELDLKYRLDDNIIRYLTTYVDEKTLKSKEAHFKKKAIEMEKRAEEEKKEENAEAPSEKPSEEKVSEEKTTEKTSEKPSEKKPSEKKVSEKPSGKTDGESAGEKKETVAEDNEVKP